MACMSARAAQPSRRGVFTGEVLANDPICAEHYRLRLLVAGFPPSRAGQFVQVQCRALGEPAGYRVLDWPEGTPPRFTDPELTRAEPLLRRPLSLAGRVGEELEIIYRTVGHGTSWLAGVGVGALLSVLGPLGNGFSPPAGNAAALVAGGVGIPPMLYLAEALAAAGVETVAFCGVRSADLLCVHHIPGVAADPTGEPVVCIQEFAAHGIPTAVATDDGSLGYPGLVSEAFGRWLVSLGAAAPSLTVYACGPEPMMQAVAELCLARRVPCQVAMERHMACGVGTCQSCVVKIRDDSPAGYAYKLCCTDGPIFAAEQVLWK